MTFPFIIRSHSHKTKNTDYKSKYAKVVQYLNETPSNSRHDRSTEKAVAIFFLSMILIISIMVVITAYFK
jgi:hypothetical protein